MGLFGSSKSWTASAQKGGSGKSYRDTNVKNSRIDRSTGRNKRDKSPVTETRGVRPQRHNGKIVKGGRAAAAREKKTGVAEPRRSWWK